MSNCIDFERGSHVVTLTKEDIDIEKFSKDFNSAITYMQEHPDFDNFDSKIVYWYWYLTSKNVFIYGFEKITISFGKGNSTHTWRDFDGTLLFLKPYIKKSVIKIFYLRDESDGFKGETKYVADLFNPKRLEEL